MKFLQTLFLVALTLSATAETFKEGVITYEISMPKMNGEDVDEQMKAMMPYETVNYYKGDKLRTEMKAGFGTSATIMEQGKDSILVLMEMMGMKTYRRMPVDNPKMKRSDKKPEITYTGETKKVAGYTCKKTLFTFETEEGEKAEMEAWITEEIEVPVQGNPDFQSIKGLALEYDFSMREMSMHLKAVKIEKVPVGDEMFTIPDGYTEGAGFPGMK
ncbi:MAG: hypothetical protein RL021_842 [Bacteroidota bacterium]